MIIKAFTLFNLFLIVIASYFGVKFGYQVLLPEEILPELTIASTPVSPVARKAVKKPLTAYHQIVDRNLFDTKPKAPDQYQPVVGKDVPDGSQELGLKLWGTVAGHKGYTYAVIEDQKERKQNLYTVDDKIKDKNATIRLILREQVILSVNGKDMKLMIEKIDATAPRRGFAAAPSRGIIHRMGGTPVAYPTQKITLRRVDIDKSMNDLPNLMGQIKIRPNLVDGNPDGLKVSSIKPRSIFRRMGLRNGDVITGVNGQEILSVDDALKLYDSLKSAPNATVQIKRRGREKTIKYNIR